VGDEQAHHITHWPHVCGPAALVEGRGIGNQRHLKGFTGLGRPFTFFTISLPSLTALDLWNQVPDKSQVMNGDKYKINIKI